MKSSGSWLLTLAVLAGGCRQNHPLRPEVAAGFKVADENMRAPAGTFDEREIQQRLDDNVGEDGQADGLVFGVVDRDGARVYAAGTTGDGSGRTVDGDTPFKIGSITKVFTAVLLQDMVDRGEMKLEDPVGKYLPESVRMPSRNGKEITLFDLATHSSGLPRDGPGKDEAELYPFLSGYELTRDPGAQYEYSNLGVGLLGHVIARAAGKSWEQLVVERICGPLGMANTRQTLTEEMRARAARGHAFPGRPVRDGEWHSLLEGCGALYSTGNDLLKFVAANAGIRETSITPLLQRTYAVHTLSNGRTGRLVWMEEDGFVCHGGNTSGFLSDIGFDVSKGRGIALLANCSMSRIRWIWKPALQGKPEHPGRVVEDEDLSRYAGVYRFGNKTDCVVRCEGGRLTIQWWPEGLWHSLPYIRAEAFAQGGGVFYNRFWDGPVWFEGEPDGRTSAMRIKLPKETLTLEKLSDQTPARTFVRVDTAAYERLTGRYRIFVLGFIPAGPAVNVYLKHDDLGTHLIGSASGVGTTELCPAGDEWTYISPDLGGSWVTASRKLTESGKVPGLVLNGAGKGIRARRVSDEPDRPPAE